MATETSEKLTTLNWQAKRDNERVLNNQETLRGLRGYISVRLKQDNKFAKISDIKAENGVITILVEKPESFNRFPGYDWIRERAEEYLDGFISRGNYKVITANPPPKQKDKSGLK